MEGVSPILSTWHIIGAQWGLNQVLNFILTKEGVLPVGAVMKLFIDFCPSTSRKDTNMKPTIHSDRLHSWLGENDDTPQLFRNELGSAKMCDHFRLPPSHQVPNGPRVSEKEPQPSLPPAASITLPKWSVSPGGQWAPVGIAPSWATGEYKDGHTRRGPIANCG